MLPLRTIYSLAIVRQSNGVKISPPVCLRHVQLWQTIAKQIVECIAYKIIWNSITFIDTHVHFGEHNQQFSRVARSSPSRSLSPVFPSLSFLASSATDGNATHTHTHTQSFYSAS